MRTKLMRLTALIAILTAVAVVAPRTQGAEEPERLIVKCVRPCLGVATTVSVIGGEVTYAYENVDAIAVAVPAGRVAELSAAVGADAIRKDVEIERPVPIAPLEAGSVAAEQTLVGDALESQIKSLPANYNYNNALTGAASLHAAGLLGQNVVVAVIDTGVQIAASALGPVSGGTVIGGENLVPLTTDPVASATSRLNDWHGTTVSDMIAAHVNFVFANTSTLVQSLRVHSPSSVVPCPGPPFTADCPETASIIPMIGQAPAAKVYALKVFSSRGGGAPESRIIAAMDRAITLRRHFNEGAAVTPVRGSGTEDDPYVYDSLNIQVVNMSLGGPTLFAGHELEDELTEALLDVGIVVTSAAGNTGFGAMTVESPGTGFGALAVAAANTPVHERVLRDQQLGLGGGLAYRPSAEIQTAYFSSRGPLADGRSGPHLIANGFASYTNAFAALTANNDLTSCGALNAVAGSCLSRILFVSGTSFSTPTVAGAAALLRSAVPGARAEKVRKALIRGADKHVLGDWSGPFDQGAGFLDVPAALTLLNSALPGTHDDCDDEDDDVGEKSCGERRRADRHEDGPDEVGSGGRSVIRNVRGAGVSIVQFKQDRFTDVVKRLKAGQVQQFFIPVDARTDRLTIRITDVVPEGPQNTIFGDDFFVMGIDAPTSTAVHRIGIPAGAEGAFVNGDATFVIDNPQTGLFRLALQGDWTNGGVISGRVAIERERSRLGPGTATGPVEQDDLIPVTVNVPAGVSQAVFELFWQQNWGRYPANDLDMFIFRPDGTLFLVAGVPPGAGLNSPERAVVTDPAPGDWIVLINGFTVHDTSKGPHTGRDEFTLRVTADGSLISTR